MRLTYSWPRGDDHNELTFVDHKAKQLGETQIIANETGSIDWPQAEGGGPVPWLVTFVLSQQPYLVNLGIKSKIVPVIVHSEGHILRSAVIASQNKSAYDCQALFTSQGTEECRGGSVQGFRGNGRVH